MIFFHNLQNSNTNNHMSALEEQEIKEENVNPFDKSIVNMTRSLIAQLEENEVFNRFLTVKELDKDHLTIMLFAFYMHPERIKKFYKEYDTIDVSFWYTVANIQKFTELFRSVPHDKERMLFWVCKQVIFHGVNHFLYVTMEKFRPVLAC